MRALDHFDGRPETVSFTLAAADALHLLYRVEPVLPQLDALHGAKFGAPATACTADFGDDGILQGPSPKDIVLQIHRQSPLYGVRFSYSIASFCRLGNA